MKKKARFFWIYTMILFSAAFVLILFSAFSGTRYQAERSKTQRLYQGAQKSLGTLTDENEALRAQSAQDKKTIDELTERVRQMTEEATRAHEANLRYAASVEALLEAEALAKSRDYDKAEEALGKVDQSLLDGNVLSLYNRVKKQIDANG